METEVCRQAVEQRTILSNMMVSGSQRGSECWNKLGGQSGERLALRQRFVREGFAAGVMPVRVNHEGMNSDSVRSITPKAQTGRTFSPEEERVIERKGRKAGYQVVSLPWTVPPVGFN